MSLSRLSFFARLRLANAESGWPLLLGVLLYCCVFPSILGSTIGLLPYCLSELGC